MQNPNLPWELEVLLTCGWYTLRDFTLCSGNKTLMRNILCSSFRGKANPLIMLRRKKSPVKILTQKKYSASYLTKHTRTHQPLEEAFTKSMVTDAQPVH